MTHPDPARTEGPKRSTRFNGVVAGAYVWSRWSADDDSAADNAADRTVQPAELPPPDAGSLSPEGAEAAR